MTFKFQKRRGIGNVITTLIILIASVVLGAGVIFFGGSMFQTNTQSESLKVTNAASWVNSVASPPAGQVTTTAFVVQNTGSKAITINQITMRGVQVPTSNWFYLITSNTTLLQTQLPVDYTENPITGIGATTPGGPLSLNQGQAAIVYLSEAGNFLQIDSGNTYSLQIQAGGVASAVQQVQVITATGT